MPRFFVRRQALLSDVFASSCGWRILLALGLAMPVPAPASPAIPGAQQAAPDLDGYFAHRQQQLQRLATIGQRISAAAAPDCPGGQAFAGFILDLPDQYADGVAGQLGFAPGDNRPRILALAPDSTAAQAGLAPGDRLLIWSADHPLAARRPSFASVEAALDALEAARPAPDAPLALAVEREGRRIAITLPARPGCGGWFDLAPSARLAASSTRRWVQLSEGLLARFEEQDDAIAFVVAHEMAHRAARLADVARGAAYDAAPCDEACEEAADTRAIAYMRQAGYDPQVAPIVLEQVMAQGGWWDALNGRHTQLERRTRHLRALLAP